MISLQAKKLFGVLILSFVILLTYQNCSRGTSFEVAPSTVDSPTNPETPVNSNAESGTYSKSVQAFQPTNEDLDLYLLIDDSKSNALNSNAIAQDLKKLLTRLTALEKQSVTVHAYSMGYQGDTAKATNVFKSASGRIDYNAGIPNGYLRISEYLRGKPIVKFTISATQSQSEIDSSVANEFTTLQQHLTTSSTLEAGSDKTPFPFCDIVTLLSENKTATKKKTSAFILVTDEDVSKNSVNNQCTKHWDIVYLKGSGGSPFVIVPASRLVDAEGGGKISVPESVQITTITSCSNTTGISAYLSSLGYTTNDNTFSSCYVYNNALGNDTQQKVTYYSWTEEPFISTESQKQLNFLAQMKRIMALPMQGPVFIGLFSIQNSSEIKNVDQEISINLNAALPQIVPKEQFQIQSMTSPVYNSFYDQVINFKLNSSFNTTSIADLIAKIPAGKSLVITEVSFTPNQSNTAVKINSFSRNGNDLLINDPTVKLSDGGQLSMTYKFQ